MVIKCAKHLAVFENPCDSQGARPTHAETSVTSVEEHMRGTALGGVYGDTLCGPFWAVRIGVLCLPPFFVGNQRKYFGCLVSHSHES